jgi:hypothetical protein
VTTPEWRNERRGDEETTMMTNETTCDNADADEGRAQPPVVARHEERDAEGTGWYVYVGGEDAGGPFETEADALEHWRS